MNLLRELLAPLFPRKLAVDHSHRRQAPERLPQHWLYVLLCAAACVASLWKFGHPDWTMTVMIAMPFVAALAYIPYRVIPSWIRFLLQLLITAIIGIWMVYRLQKGISADKALIEVLAGACLIFLMAQNVRDYSYLFALSTMLLLYGALLPRTIYLWCLFTAFAITLYLLYNNRLRQLASAPSLRNPQRIVRRNWHIIGLHLGLAALFFTFIFPRFPTDMGDTRGLFSVSFMHDKQSLLPPDLRHWFSSEQVEEGNEGDQIIRGTRPDLLSMTGLPFSIKNSQATASGRGGDGASPPGRDLVFRVKSPLKLYHVAQLYDRYDGTQWSVSEGLKNSRVLNSREDHFQQVSLYYTIFKWLGPKLYAPYRPLLFEQRSDSTAFGLFRTSAYNAELALKNYPQLPFSYLVTSLLSTDRTLAEGLEGGSASLQPWVESVPPKYYLQLPEEKISARLRKLVETLTEDCHSDYEKAVRLRDYLRNVFPYEQFSQPVPAGKEGVDYFIFELKKGHCEYFASSLAVLARLAGLPARVATGFSPGDYNTLLNVFEVYEYHGHAWTQIFVKEYGWLTMDATPPGHVESNTTPLGIGQLRDPFGDEWRITPPELTTHTLETLKDLYLKRLRADEPMDSKTAEMLLQMSRVQDEIRNRVQKTYQKVAAKTARKPGEKAPLTFQERLRRATAWIQEAAGKISTLIREHTALAVAVLLMIPVLFVLVRFALRRLGLRRMRRSVVRNFARAREGLKRKEYRESVLAAYHAARTLLSLAKFRRYRGEELLDYAARLEQEHPELDDVPGPVFLAFYEAEYGVGPIARRSAVLTLRRARSLCRLLAGAKNCRGLYAASARKDADRRK